MEYISPQHLKVLEEFLNIAKRDPKAEVECKLLSGKIQTKDVIDRIVSAVQTMSIGPPTEEQYLTIGYPGDTRVVIRGVHPIHKVCSNNSFREIPLEVERKERYYDGKRDVLDVSEINAKFTLRRETPVKKDYDGSPSDPKAYFRLINRKSYNTQNGLFQIDISMVKSKDREGKVKLIRDVLKQPHTYELEIEFVGEKTKLDTNLVVQELMQITTTILKAYHQTSFLLTQSDIQKYEQEFRKSGHIFFNPVTMVRKHIRPGNPHNVSKGYTVTNKADGQRSGLYISNDGRVLKITPKLQVTWTGLKVKDNSHAGDFLDGEFIADKNLFCIFDVYRFRKRDTRNIPLMTNDEDILKNPLNSRLGCAHLFLEDMREFQVEPSLTPMRIEAKLFLAGDGVMMEQAIAQLLDTEFEYKTDGLIFTPRVSGVAPQADRNGSTWTRVYKWKPADQNSIDFLVRFTPTRFINPVDSKEVIKGELYVSRNAKDIYVYPREMMTGEYMPRDLPADFELLNAARIPSLFQPSVPRDPDAYQILIPLNERGVPIDEENQKVENNTIIECAFDIDTRQWTIMRTRYDKTYQYKVLGEAQYGNDVSVANSIWTSMHVPVTADMLKKHYSEPIDDTMEDDMYYRDDIKRDTRAFTDVYAFHNRIKEDLYSKYVKKGDTLLELAVGKGGDLQKWIKAQPSKIVGMDISLSNLASPVDSASKRYLEKKKDGKLPPLLLVQGSFTSHPLFEQSDKYMPILLGSQTGHTDYLKHFEGLSSFEDVSCQFAMHYACESEETFRKFGKNVRDSCKEFFFGTCSDGQAIYSLLIGKNTHLFTVEGRVAGEYTKEYRDKDNWAEEFGMPVKVYLESFVKPEIEYLVPFGKVTEIMEEMGFELQESKLFSEIYENQTRITLGEMQRDFSFLNRAFVFKRVRKFKEPEEKEPEEEKEEDKEEEEKEEDEEEAEDKPKESVEEEIEKVAEEKRVEAEKEAEKPKKRKLKKAEAEPEPILFAGADESQGSYREFSNISNHPVEIDGTKYPSVEHYYQAMKAVEFKDEDTLKKVMKTKTSKAVKALGNKVKDYNEEVWKAKQDEVMEKAVRAKFVQHPELREKLVETGDKTIGYADARDLYWSIGTSMGLDKAKSPSKWRGQNKLGKILMKLREVFMDES
jgi:ribA/ribD-fused uncharacterized protein